MSQSGYVAGLISIPNDGAEHNLLVLIRTQLDPNCPGAAREVNLQAAKTNGGLIYFGAPTVTSANYAYTLGAGDSRNYHSDLQNVQLGNISVFTATGSIGLGVEVMVV